MKRLASFAVAVAALTAIGAASAAGTTRLTIAPRSSLVLSGSSNVASWRCTATTLNGSMNVAEPIEKINDVIDHIEDGQIAAWMGSPNAGTFPQPTFNLDIPIAALRCSGGRPMESDLRAALRAAQHPDISFRFVQLRGGVEHDIDRHLYQAAIEGELSLAGATRPIELTVQAERLSRDLFRVHATLPLKMTDFAITPPKALFGIVRAADDLVVDFNVLLKP